MDPRYQRLLHDSLSVSAERHPHKPVAVVEGKPYTYAQLLESVLRLSDRLRKAGIVRGDRVAIYMDNTWPCLVSIFATLAAGGVFLAVNPQTKADKLNYVLNDSGAKVLLTHGHLGRVFVPALENTPSLGTVIYAGELPHPLPKPSVSFEESLAQGSPVVPNATVISLDLAALIYTSGSTGLPKGVMMTHEAMTFTSGSLIEYLRLSPDDRILSFLPLAFDYGLYQFLMSVRLGATLVLERSFTYPAQILDRLVKERVSVFPGVPTVFMTLVGMHARAPLGFPSVRRLTNTAAALPPAIVPKLREIFPNALIFRMYGLTECKRVSYLEPDWLDRKSDSVGKAIPGTEVYLLSKEGHPVNPGEPGILHVRGPHVMLGYWNKPEESAAMLKPGRYPGERVLCTQDWFTMDADGFLYFQGRSDDIIKCRGEKVSPVEVENCLHGIPGVREAAVLGVPDDVLGESIRAFVALEKGSSLTEKDIKAVCSSKLENFMVPREVVFLPDLPKTATGKIRKMELRGETGGP